MSLFFLHETDKARSRFSFKPQIYYALSLLSGFLAKLDYFLLTKSCLKCNKWSMLSKLAMLFLAKDKIRR